MNQQNVTNNQMSQIRNKGTGPGNFFIINKLTLFFHSLLPWKNRIFGAYFVVFGGLGITKEKKSNTQLSSYDQALDFTGSLPNLQEPLIPVEFGNRIFLHQSVASIDLNSFVGNSFHHLARVEF